MKHRWIVPLLTACLASTSGLLGACSEDLRAPTATVIAASQALVGETVQLGAEVGNVSEDALVTYSWSFLSRPAGSEAAFNGSRLANPSFVPDLAGTYEIQLVVSDGVLDSTPARAVIEAGPCGGNVPVVAVIESDPVTPTVGQTVRLSAQVSDDDTSEQCGLEEAFSHRWQLREAPAGSEAQLNDSTSVNPWLVADVSGTYRFELTVTDSSGHESELASFALIVLTCGEAYPVVESVTADPAAPDVGEVTLLSAEWSDADNEPQCGAGQTVSYQWTLAVRPAGSQTNIEGGSLANPWFSPDLPGSYAVVVAVTDSTGRASQPARLDITAGECGTNRPQIDAVNVSPAAPNTGDQVALGVEVSDDDTGEACGDPAFFSYEWWFRAVPEGSLAEIRGSRLSNPTFVTDQSGDYEVAVRVGDVRGLTTGVSTVVVTASECGAAPPVAELSASPAAPVIGQPVVLRADVEDADEWDGTEEDNCRLDESFTYEWVLIELPEGSLAELTSIHSKNAGLVPDTAGVYVIEGRVWDRLGYRNVQLLVDDPEAEEPILVGDLEIVLDVEDCGAATPVVTDIVWDPASPILQHSVRLEAEVDDADTGVGCDLVESVSYSWRFTALPDGSRATLDDPSASRPMFTPDQSGSYSVGLVVEDRTGRPSLERVETFVITDSCGEARPVVAGVTVQPASPNIDQPVRLVPNVTDADTLLPCGLVESFEYRWALTAVPVGSEQTVDDPSARVATFTPDLPGNYEVTLTVRDRTGQDSDPFVLAIDDVDICGSSDPSVEAINVLAGSGGVGARVYLDADVSDGDEDCGLVETFEYDWGLVSVPAGSDALMNEAFSGTPSFVPDISGDYVVRLVVTDSTGRTDRGQRTVAVADCGENDPVIVSIDVTPSAGISVGQRVFVSARVSDADMAPSCGLLESFEYVWSVLSAPAGSAVLLADAGTPNPSFVPDLDGDYDLQLVVIDSTGRTDVATLGDTGSEVSVDLCGDSPPVAVAKLGNVTCRRNDRVQVELLGEDSWDPDTDPGTDAACGGLPGYLTYEWEVTRLPVDAELREFQPGFSAINPWFEVGLRQDCDQTTDDRFEVRLFVTDESGNTSLPDELTVYGCAGCN